MLSVARDLALYFAFMLAAMSALSLPLAPATLLAVKTIPPLSVALTAATAAFIAAFFDHYLVRRVFRVRHLDVVRRKKLFQKAERWAAVAPFLTTGAFAGLPVPFGIARVLVPLSGYPAPKYAAAVAVGRFLRIFVIATFGAVVEIPTEVLVGLFIAGLLIAAVTALVRGRDFLPRTSVPEAPGTLKAMPAREDHPTKPRA